MPSIDDMAASSKRCTLDYAGGGIELEKHISPTSFAIDTSHIIPEHILGFDRAYRILRCEPLSSLSLTLSRSLSLSLPPSPSLSLPLSPSPSLSLPLFDLLYRLTSLKIQDSDVQWSRLEAVFLLLKSDLATNPTRDLGKVFTTLKAVLQRCSEELVEGALEHLAELLPLVQKDFVSSTLFAFAVVQSRAVESALRDAYREFIVACVPHLNTEASSKKAIALATENAWLTNFVEDRVFAAKLFAALSLKFHLDETAMDVIRGLLGDEAPIVRVAALKAMANSIEHDLDLLTEQSILDARLIALLDRIRDVHPLVRATAVKTYAVLLDTLPETIWAFTPERLLGYYTRPVENAVRETNAYLALLISLNASVAPCSFGFLLPPSYYESTANVASADRKKVLEVFAKLAQHGSHASDTAYWAAHNFPAMLSACIIDMRASRQPAHHPLLQCFRSLVNSNNVAVRRKMAASLPEVINMLRPSLLNTSSVLECICRLIDDVDLDMLSYASCIPDIGARLLFGATLINVGLICLCRVLSPIAQNFDRIVQSFAWKHSSRPASSDSNHAHSAAINAHHTVEMPIEFLVSVSKSLARMLPAWRTLKRMAEHCERQRQHSTAWLRHHLAEHECCYQRMLFVNVAMEATRHFSIAFFKQHFVGSLLSLALDPVLNVRRSAIPRLLTIKKRLRLPLDRELVKRLDTVAENLLDCPPITKHPKAWSAYALPFQAELDAFQVPISWDVDQLVDDVAEENAREQDEESVALTHESPIPVHSARRPKKSSVPNNGNRRSSLNPMGQGRGEERMHRSSQSSEDGLHHRCVSIRHRDGVAPRNQPQQRQRHNFNCLASS
ncbi:uncharacterized protein MONBRDRAFT_31281 [Monosiga brevicollis MX1]|uniref:Serine/threonine-protein phosphatase 4 regulatory subunit 4 n=1 Tax=Monosiga brevicollis TaxID=81824 RepID=A9USU8_MONBE|nr:uncharacterized protein MONBRDRAFT_31281 [Monosiga brevicollis MX1]EDQ92167.1 predicted protein [Monosiga brevicollis MX1]|eukprot:XP_001743453.1 hypothetical protein [Monosiga brevicollis MX1]